MKTKPKHNAIFDYQHFYFDDDGYPHLKSHVCGNCGHVVEQPEDQELFLDDQGEPVGLVVQTPCPKCSHQIFSACGAPDFVDFVQSALSVSGIEPFAPKRSRFSTN